MVQQVHIGLKTFLDRLATQEIKIPLGSEVEYIVLFKRGY